MTKRWQKRARVMLIFDDSEVIPDDQRWTVTVENEANLFMGELDPDATPGQALDRAVKWAMDRGMELALQATMFEAGVVVDD